MDALFIINTLLIINYLLPGLAPQETVSEVALPLPLTAAVLIRKGHTGVRTHTPSAEM